MRRWVVLLIGALVIVKVADAKTISRQIRIRVIVPKVQKVKLRYEHKREAGKSIYDLEARVSNNSTGWRLTCDPGFEGVSGVKIRLGKGREVSLEGKDSVSVLSYQGGGPQSIRFQVVSWDRGPGLERVSRRLAITLVPN